LATREQKCLHDFIAGTVVLHDRTRSSRARRRRVARELPDDHSTIMEVLTTFVCERSCQASSLA
jgi:hypothetical protein